MSTLSAIFFSDLNVLVTASEKCVAITSSKVGFDVSSSDHGELLSVYQFGQNLKTFCHQRKL